MKNLVRTTVLFAIAGSASWLPSAVAADAAKDCIRGSVKMSASLTGEIKPGATLFVYAREAERSKGAPTVVTSVKEPSYPQAFSLCPENQMLPGAASKPLSAAYRVYARHSATGKPMVSEGFAGSSAGAKGAGIRTGDTAEVIINRKLGKPK